MQRTKISMSSGTMRPNFTLIKRGSRQFEKLFMEAMYYIHYECSCIDLKAATIKYVSRLGGSAEMLDRLDDYNFAVVGKACVIANAGGDLPQEWQDFVIAEVAKLHELGSNKIEIDDCATSNVKRKPVSINEAVENKSREIAGVLESLVDEYLSNSSAFKTRGVVPSEILRAADVKPQHAKCISSMFESNVDEMREVVEGGNEELNEGYSHLTKAQCRYILDLYLVFIAAANEIVETAPKPKQRPVDKEKVVSKLKCASSIPALKISGITPSRILGAKSLWVYNTKTRKLGKYVAKTADGLTVKGTTICNFSEELSVEKTVRKPERDMQAFVKLSGKSKSDFLNTLSTVDTRMCGRVSSNCVLIAIE